MSRSGWGLFELDLWQSSILFTVGVLNLVCGYILSQGCRVSHTVNRSLRLIYENILSLGGILSFL